MTDTTRIKNLIDPYVREWLSKKYASHHFTEKDLELTDGGSYKFDAVSDDNSIVGDILSNRASTSGGNENTGGVRKAQNVISYLNRLPKGTIRIMVFTDVGFHRLIERRSYRWGAKGIHMIECTLPPNLENIRQSILNEASQEQL